MHVVVVVVEYPSSYDDPSCFQASKKINLLLLDQHTSMHGGSINP
jgi:hypothetical protein